LGKTRLLGIAAQKYILHKAGRYNTASQLLSCGYQKLIAHFTRACHLILEQV
jgi:hypothetical protein